MTRVHTTVLCRLIYSGVQGPGPAPAEVKGGQRRDEVTVPTEEVGEAEPSGYSPRRDSDVSGVSQARGPHTQPRAMGFWVSRVQVAGTELSKQVQSLFEDLGTGRALANQGPGSVVTARWDTLCPLERQ